VGLVGGVFGGDGIAHPKMGAGRPVTEGILFWLAFGVVNVTLTVIPHLYRSRRLIVRHSRDASTVLRRTSPGSIFPPARTHFISSLFASGQSC